MSGGITDQLARAKNKAWRALHFWLDRKRVPEVERADPKKIASQFPPLVPAEIASTLQMRIATLRKAEKDGKAPPSIL